MIVRSFGFMNSFFAEVPKAVCAEYNSIGYFDGLDIQLLSEGESIPMTLEEWIGDPFRYRLWDLPVNTDNANIIGTGLIPPCDFDHMIGLRRGDDSFFWNTSGMPIILITNMRLRESPSNLEKAIWQAEYEAKGMLCVYTTLDYSDLLLCLKVKSFGSAYRELMGLEKHFNVHQGKGNFLKGFSSLIICQQKLDDEMNIETKYPEKLDVEFRVNVKDHTKTEGFISLLEKELGTENLIVHGIFGSDDYRIEAKEIVEGRLIQLYRTGGLLVHTNPAYREAFYNIRTEILSPQGGVV